ncbi:uncharacterized protein LOC122068169 [Macadamia integrifolia]|uniref:uncharacterized protein LOC122068169 n=1 Tax=Macadamia integrifolia TaxID=60698 RepID=UPI001C4EED76|nr:uncharacterized protein LOC122068169 [Macadamia integrifolia]
MADQRLDRLETEMETLAAAQDRKFQELMESMQQMFAAVNTKLDNVATIREVGESSHYNHPRKGGRTHNGAPNSSGGAGAPKVVKLDFPKYNGEEDPTSWVCRADQFFEYHRTPVEERVPLASWNLEGDAQLWYQLLKDENDNAPITWQEFKKEIFVRYGPSHYQDFFGELTKLRQIGTVREYQNQFSKLLLRAGKLSSDQQVGCFTRGLKENLKVDVQACQPTTLSAAIGLTRLYESRNQASRTMLSAPLKKPVNSPSNPSTGLPIKRLTPAKLSERRAKGLCFNCNEKFGPGHRCKKLFLIEGSWSDDEEDLSESDIIPNDAELPEISIHAISGAKNTQTMRVQGKLGHHRVIFLIDSASTHNFMNDRIAKKVGLVPSHEGNFEVAVANGEKLPSPGRCKGVTMSLQGIPVTVDFYLLPLQGCDAVLGAQWLSSLGPIIWDFSKLQMTFHVNGKKAFLNGLQTPMDRVMDGLEMSKEIKKKKEGMLLQIYSLSMQQPLSVPLLANFSNASNINLEPLLQKYDDLFHEPMKLPPMRFQDHQIPLKDGSQPVSV